MKPAWAQEKIPQCQEKTFGVQRVLRDRTLLKQVEMSESRRNLQPSADLVYRDL